MSTAGPARHIVFLVHYFPPLNSSGAKRVEALSKYFARSGRQVTVITTVKRRSDGDFTEPTPPGVTVHHISPLGRIRTSIEAMQSTVNDGTPMARPGVGRRVKNVIMRWFGQLPEPRLPWAFAMLSPLLASPIRSALCDADVVIGSNPPWPTLLAATFVRWRFRRPIVLDYRDHFSECHEMPGSRWAKRIETLIDRAMAQGADSIVTVSEPMARYYRAFNPQVTVITNGYDAEIIDAVCSRAAWRPRDQGQPVVVRYLGLITPDRIPRNVLGALLRLTSGGKVSVDDIRFECYGECSVLETAVSREYGALKPMFRFMSPVSYQRALELTATADYLLFAETSYKKTLSAQGILTTKLFEYLAVGRPIIADIDPSTIAGQMILRCGPVHFVSNDLDAFEAKFGHPAFVSPAATEEHPYVRSLSRSAQARQYLAHIDSLMGSVRRGVSADASQSKVQ
jgi:glycosyltransferase involved in cell wall biosynthesis